MQNLAANDIVSVRSWFRTQMEGIYPEPEIKALEKMAFEHLFDVKPVDIALNPDMRLSESQLVSLYKMMKKLSQHIPIQYITGSCLFRGRSLEVNPAVLIPRPETEELVDWVIEDTQALPNGVIWDIGSGSGAIAISLAFELSNAQVWASDLSEEALQTARHNATNHGVDIQFWQQDILEGPLPQTTFDIIVSNPPYVRESEKALMKANVLEHEPSLALFVPDKDPLIFYRAIGLAAMQVLRPGGILFLEINESLAEETAYVLRNTGLENISHRKDFHGKDRFIRAQKPSEV